MIHFVNLLTTDWMIASSSCDLYFSILINLRLIIFKVQVAIIFVTWSINRWDWHSSFLFLYFSSPPREHRDLKTQELLSHFTLVTFFTSISFLWQCLLTYALKQNTRMPKTNRKIIFYYSLWVSLCQETWRHIKPCAEWSSGKFDGRSSFLSQANSLKITLFFY